MTDLAPDLDALAETDPAPAEPGVGGAPPVDTCQYPGCDTPLPQPHHPMRKYCDSHQPIASKRRRKGGGGGGAPRITVNVGGARRSAKVEDDLARVEVQAAQLARLVAVVIHAVGQTDDAADIVRGADPWAASVRGLAEHEAWIRKLAAGGENSARAMAWLQFAIATGALVLPILVRHGAVPDHIAGLMGAMVPPDVAADVAAA